MASHLQIREAARALRAGGVIAYPTETVYGLGCQPLDQAAVERILELKKRPVEKGLILIGASLEQLLPYIEVGSTEQLQTLARPGERPTTWICPMAADVPRWLHGRHHSIAVRITTSPLARQLCNLSGGALVSTSANPSGLAPARSLLAIRRYFGGGLDYALGGHCDPRARPSRIIDLVSGRVVRS